MDRLVDVGRTQDGRGFDTVSYPTYADLRDHNSVFTGMFAVRFEPRPVSLGGPDGADRAFSQEVSASYFEVLGVTARDRTRFPGRDERLGVPLREVVLSDAFWRAISRAIPTPSAATSCSTAIISRSSASTPQRPHGHDDRRRPISGCRSRRTRRRCRARVCSAAARTAGS